MSLSQSKAAPTEIAAFVADIPGRVVRGDMTETEELAYGVLCGKPDYALLDRILAERTAQAEAESHSIPFYPRALLDDFVTSIAKYHLHQRRATVAMKAIYYDRIMVEFADTTRTLGALATARAGVIDSDPSDGDFAASLQRRRAAIELWAEAMRKEIEREEAALSTTTRADMSAYAASNVETVNWSEFTLARPTPQDDYGEAFWSFPNPPPPVAPPPVHREEDDLGWS